MSKLADWIKAQGMRKGEFAEKIGVSNSYVSGLCADPPTWWPGKDVATRIREATNGAVTADDFLPLRNESIQEQT